MDVKLEDTFTAGTLAASIEVAELAPVPAAVSAIAQKNSIWETAAGKLIEEWKTLSSDAKKDLPKS